MHERDEPTKRQAMAMRCGLDPDGPSGPAWPTPRVAALAGNRGTGRTTNMLLDVLVAIERGERPTVVVVDELDRSLVRLGELAGVPTDRAKVRVLGRDMARTALRGTAGPVFVDHRIKDDWAAAWVGIQPARIA